MVGLERLDDLQACVESVISDGVEGDVIEAGTWRGGAAILARATLDSLGADDRTVVLADSFQGLPAPDGASFPQDVDLDLSRVDFLSPPRRRCRVTSRVSGSSRGWSSFPGSSARRCPISGVVAGPSYGSTATPTRRPGSGSTRCTPGLSRGGYLIIDDYGLIPECRGAVDDFRREHGITEPIEKADWNGVRWRREDQADLASPSATSTTRRRCRVQALPAGCGRATDSNPDGT